MRCRVDGCERDAVYVTASLCQKHYFRLRRNGHLERLLDKKRKDLGYSRVYRRTMPGKGYQMLYEPNHPLSWEQGYVSEHRKVVYDRYGKNLPDCEICGSPTCWETCHIDHIDRDVTNNSEENLRPLCRACNTQRDYPEQWKIRGNHSITYEGKTMTPTEWARDPRVKVSGRTVVLRKSKGFSDEDALFAPKATHNGKKRIPPERKTQFKHERKNSVAITIEGKTLTAAEWAREPMVTVSAAGIVWRIKQGWEPSRAVFQPRRFSKNTQT